MNWNDFRGAARRLDDIDLPRIGASIGVGEDEIHAFMDVEAAGAGFDASGRPKMLFEPHVFYRNLVGEKRQRAVAAGLAYPKWKPGSYPKDSYLRLIRAMAIDETAALKAASWGLGQVLGENHKALGYETPQAMVLAFMDDEERHVEGIVAFLTSAGIDDDLRAHRWEVVARVYNGPGFRQHNYHGRMAAAYAKWAKIRDTPWSSERGGTAESEGVASGDPGRNAGAAADMAPPPDDASHEAGETGSEPARPAGFSFALGGAVALGIAALAATWLGAS